MNNFREGLNALKEISDPEKMKMALERITNKKLADYEGIDALVGALMGYYNGELKKKLNTDEINEKLKNFCPYSVGEILLTTNSENPASKYLGTTWQKIEGRFLLGTSGSGSSKATGGSNNIKLSVDNLPPHTHSASTSAHTHTQPNHTHRTRMFSHGGATSILADYIQISHSNSLYDINEYAGGETTGSASPVTSIGSTGNGNSINITPSYYTVHMWLRTS